MRDISYADFKARIAAGSDMSPNQFMVITANQRQNRQLQNLSASLGASSNAPVYQSPKLRSLQAWVSELWRDFEGSSYINIAEPLTLIDDYEASLFWSKLSEVDELASPLIDRQDFLRQIESAYDITQQYRIDDQSLKAESFDETSAFITIKTAYHRFLRLNGCIDRYQLLEKLIAANQKAKSDESKLHTGQGFCCYFYGFSDIPPLYKHAAYAIYGEQQVFLVSEPSRMQSIEFASSATAEDELNYAIRWAQKQVSESQHDANESESEVDIAIVVPELNAQKNNIKRAFQKAFEPHTYIKHGASKIPSIFDISAGDPLYEFAAVKTALTLPALAKDTISKQELEFLFRSPYWGDGFSELRQVLYEKLALSNKNLINIFDLISDYVALFDKAELDESAVIATELGAQSADALASESQLESQSEIQNESLQPDLFGDYARSPESERSIGINPADSLDSQEVSRDLVSELSEKSLSSYRKDLSFLLSLRAQSRGFKQKKSHSQWVEFYLGYLQLACFPGSHTLESSEFQLVSQFLKNLSELKSNDRFSSHAISFNEFLVALEAKAKTTIFHVEVVKPKIHIMGLMEASGLLINNCLVLGMTNEALPKPAQPHPFLPRNLQIRFDTPKSSSERELKYAERFLHSLVNSSKNIFFSYHSLSESEEKAPSPLLTELERHYLNEKYLNKKHLNEKHLNQKHLDHASTQNLTVATTEADNNTAYTKSEELTDAFIEAQWLGKKDFLQKIITGHAPEIPTGTQLKGGAYLLDLQWLNPQFAFFRYRLGIDNKEPEVLGLSRMQRGTVVHAFFQKLLDANPDQKSLEAFSQSPNYDETLRSFARSTLSSNYTGDLFQAPSIYAFEFEQLVSISKVFIDKELSRSQPFRVAALEAKQSLDINGYSLPMRLDRIDLVASEASDSKSEEIKEYKIVFDYKTGSTSLSGVVKQTLSDYQLPLYCHVSTDSLHAQAVVYVELKADSAEFKGICDEGIELDGVLRPNKVRYSELSDDWQQTLVTWRSSIEQRVQEFTEGVAWYEPRAVSKQAYYLHYDAAIRQEEKLNYVSGVRHRGE